ncbi:MAG: aromatic ring-opening dioxygenase subunit LigB [Armatimonadetes bacterium]|nr:aromatic ring-opening dioxygenase subunit LigB [Armatimonadota bacterium]
MLTFAAIAPHGGDIVSQIAGDPATMAQTRAAMRNLGDRCAATQPETVVVVTPHGLMPAEGVSVGMTAHAAGMLDVPDGRYIKAAFGVDTDLARQIIAAGETHELPFYRLAGEKNGADAVLPLDWGALIPLWFVAHPFAPRAKIVVLAPSPSLPRETLVRVGVAIAEAATKSGKRVALIASGDQAHAHDPAGPYGYDSAAQAHDAAMCDVLERDDFEQLLHWPPEFLEDAKVDAYYQTLILAGALGHTPMRGELLSYEAPTYFGMAVAAYAPVQFGAT